MTCKLESLHPLDALYRACKAYPGGIESLSVRLGKRASVLYSELRRQVESHRVGYDGELSEILFCLEEAGVRDWASTLHAFAWRHGHLVVPVPKALEVGDQLTEQICNSVKEHADAIAAIGASLADDNRIDEAELARIENEVEEAMSALAGLRELAREKHAAGRKSKGRN